MVFFKIFPLLLVIIVTSQPGRVSSNQHQQTFLSSLVGKITTHQKEFMNSNCTIQIPVKRREYLPASTPAIIVCTGRRSSSRCDNSSEFRENIVLCDLGTTFCNAVGSIRGKKYKLHVEYRHFHVMRASGRSTFPFRYPIGCHCVATSGLDEYVGIN